MINKKYKKSTLDDILLGVLLIVMSIVFFMEIFDFSLQAYVKAKFTLDLYESFFNNRLSKSHLYPLNYRFYKILFRKNESKQNEETEPNEAGGDVDRLKALRMLNNHFKDEGKIGHLTDRLSKISP